jgi:hypothetical protein
MPDYLAFVNTYFGVVYFEVLVRLPEVGQGKVLAYYGATAAAQVSRCAVLDARTPHYRDVFNRHLISEAPLPPPYGPSGTSLGMCR